MSDLKKSIIKLAYDKPEFRVILKPILAGILTESRYEKGVPADPTENMSPEDAEEWEQMTEKHKDKFKDEKEASIHANVMRLYTSAGNTDTFKCPECDSKVLENTKYCMKCKKKVKKANVTDKLLGTNPGLSSKAHKSVLRDLKKGDKKGAQKTIKVEMEHLDQLYKRLNKIEGEDLEDLVKALETFA